MIRKMFFLTLDLIVTGIFLAACGNAVNLEPTATRAPSASPVPPSATLAPSVAPSSSPSATPTRTTQPTRTATPTRTAHPPTLTPIPTATLIGGSAGKIAYTACIALEVWETCEISVMNADGSDVIRLTNDNLWDCCPAWSPEGSRIAFVSKRDGNLEIYVMNAAGSGLTNLTNHSAIDNSPAWSPDGARIAFYSNRDGHPEIYVMNADGSNPIQLTTNHDNYGPAWSPDGTKIAFFHDATLREWWVINTDGGNPINLTISSGWDTQIAWSPDGTKVAFVSEGAGNLREISVMNADGSAQTQLTNDELWHCCPAWSPDGRKLVYVHDIEGTPEIRVLAADGSNSISLAVLAGDYIRGCAQDPAWSPDGTRIAFVSCHARGNAEIYIMNADGSSLTQLTTTGGFGPVWLATLPEPATPRPDCTAGWTRLTGGSLAQVSAASNASNRVRSGPSLGNDVIAQLPPGTVVNVLEGPVCADGLVFWKVASDLIPDRAGWTAEGDGVEYYLEPHRP